MRWSQPSFKQVPLGQLCHLPAGPTVLCPRPASHPLLSATPQRSWNKLSLTATHFRGRNNVCYSWRLGAPSPKLYLFGWKLDPVSKNRIFPWTLVLTRLWLQSRAKLCPWDLALVKCCQMSFGRVSLVCRELSILGAARWAPAVMVTNFWHTVRGQHQEAATFILRRLGGTVSCWCMKLQALALQILPGYHS